MPKPAGRLTDLRRRWLRDRLPSRVQGQQGSAVMLHTHQGYARGRVRVPDELCARPGFASTAVYFERLAQKEMRDYDRRQRLLEGARFYRYLAGIITGLPTAFEST